MSELCALKNLTNRFLKWQKSSFQTGLDLITQDVHMTLNLRTEYLELKRLRNGGMTNYLTNENKSTKANNV